MPEFPVKIKKAPLTVQIYEPLLRAVKEEAKKQGLTLRVIVQFGLEAWLDEVAEYQYHENKKR